jgi:hypothetical protein
MKLSQIKAELAKLLVKYSSIKTDNGILNFEGEELTIDNEVYVENENGEKVKATDGEYRTEDEKVITVKDGKVEKIVEIETEVEPTEEVVELVEETIEEEVVEETIVEEPTTEEVVEMEETTEKSIDELRKEVNELYKIVDSILKNINETREDADTINDINERLKKIECASLARPAEVEFENINNKNVNTGDAKLDKFLKGFSK